MFNLSFCRLKSKFVSVTFSFSSLMLLILFILPILQGCSVMLSYHRGISCSSCHEGDVVEGNAPLKKSGNPSLKCLDCHRYEKAGDHHPSSIQPGPLGKTAKIDPDFKLYNGRMVCLTCHQIHTVEDYKRGTRNFLVGGPYEDRREICFRCHFNGKKVKESPHNGMLKGKLEYNYENCKKCHLGRPKRRAENKWGGRWAVDFRASVAFICWRCHPPMQGEFMNKHYLKRPDDASVGHLLSGNPVMPLDPIKRITCSTCHEPHEQGVLQAELAVDTRGQRIRKRLRAKPLCIRCHTGR